ncbi:MAG TPA: endonuclease Q family protein [bacterium]|nr:endonuclease Q family protein [bacterium]HPL95675.1 endonuclease Q family protein [bacterium]
MQIIADLHIHSKYSRACSKDLVLEKIDEACRIKGLDVVGTGDFTHPEWFKEMKEKLVEKEEGLYTIKTPLPGPLLVKERGQETRFICSAEISCIYSKGGKCRRLHIIVLAPSLEVVEKINLALGKIGNLKSDGRPILGVDAKELARIVLEIDDRCMIIPAHIWTPWFAMFGSKSGFDSIEECFEELTPKILAIETGLSSDAVMNWRVKNLDNVSIVSNSDAHSLANIGREANVFEINLPDEASPLSPLLRKEGTINATSPKGGDKISYDKICEIIKEKNHKEFLYTIEFYPEEGMYHYDGHRVCGFSSTPEKSKQLKNICPICKKPLTIGVLNRVEELAEIDRGENYFDKNRVPYKKLVGLEKIIAEALGVKSRNSKQVQSEYKKLLNDFKNEFYILIEAELEKLKEKTLPEIAEGIKRMREGKLIIKPGFDGQYGEVKIFNEAVRKKYQNRLF